ncbi:hypothetical protein B0H11DRAFT_1914806 [Mycena galericulata]|nr:hypothetical protein B0H11DRAFT_1914806 [Mycena galericulata]
METPRTPSIIISFRPGAVVTATGPNPGDQVLLKFENHLNPGVLYTANVNCKGAEMHMHATRIIVGEDGATVDNQGGTASHIYAEQGDSFAILSNKLLEWSLDEIDPRQKKYKAAALFVLHIERTFDRGVPVTNVTIPLNSAEEKIWVTYAVTIMGWFKLLHLLPAAKCPDWLRSSVAGNSLSVGQSHRDQT